MPCKKYKTTVYFEEKLERNKGEIYHGSNFAISIFSGHISLVNLSPAFQTEKMIRGKSILKV